LRRERVSAKTRIAPGKAAALRQSKKYGNISAELAGA
jgi:hypothetical protein